MKVDDGTRHAGSGTWPVYLPEAIDGNPISLFTNSTLRAGQIQFSLHRFNQKYIRQLYYYYYCSIGHSCFSLSVRVCSCSHSRNLICARREREEGEKREKREEGKALGGIYAHHEFSLFRSHSLSSCASASFSYASHLSLESTGRQEARKARKETGG